MNTKALLIGAAIAAYLLREHIAHALGMDAHATTTPAGGASSTSSQTTTTTPAPVVGVWPAILAKAQAEPDYIAAGTLNTHQWNTLYQSIRGTAGPAPEAIGQGDGLRRITFDEYKAAMTAANLSGLRAAPAAAIAPAAPRLYAQRFARKAWSY